MSEEFLKTTQDLTPELYKRFKRAIELGKWADGVRLKPEQTELCMEAVLNYEMAHVAEEERTGYMESQCKSQSGKDAEDDTESPLKIPSDRQKR